MREQELIVYRNFEDGDLLYDMAWLMEHYGDSETGRNQTSDRDPAVLFLTASTG